MSRCGTVRGYFDHRKADEPTCARCREAKRTYQDERRETYGRCSTEDCSDPVEARKLCSSHLDKWYRWGTPTPIRPSVAERFWQKVQQGGTPSYAPKLGSCWLWGGKRSSQGYGVFSAEQVYAHRYAYEHMVAPIPGDLTIDHLCRVQLCVNPTHLEPVTRAENSRREMAARSQAS